MQKKSSLTSYKTTDATRNYLEVRTYLEDHIKNYMSNEMFSRNILTAPQKTTFSFLAL